VQPEAFDVVAAHIDQQVITDRSPGESRRIPSHLGSCAAFRSQIRSQCGHADAGPNPWNSKSGGVYFVPTDGCRFSADADAGSK